MAICIYISLISHATATGLRQNLSNTSNKSCWSFGPAWILSFRETPSHFAEQSKTMRTFVVDLLNLTTGKCGRYHCAAAFSRSGCTFRIYPFLTYSFMVRQYSSAIIGSFLKFFSVETRRDRATEQLSGRLGCPRFHGTLTWYLPSTIVHELLTFSKAVLSS